MGRKHARVSSPHLDANRNRRRAPRGKRPLISLKASRARLLGLAIRRLPQGGPASSFFQNFVCLGSLHSRRGIANFALNGPLGLASHNFVPDMSGLATKQESR